MPAGISCKQIQTCPQHGPVRQLFLLVTWHGGSNVSSESDADAGPQTFDVVLTDCNTAWQLTGGKPQGAARLLPEAWQRAQEALSDGSATAGAYTFWASEAQQECKLFWAWQGRGAGQDVLYVALQQAADASAAVHAMMAHMMASYSSVKSALAVSSEAAARLQGSLAAQGLALRHEVAAARQHEEDLLVKFALLQNRQVAENKRLRAELEHCREQLMKLQGEDELNTDDEERAAELGAAYAAETDEDSDEAMQEESPAAAPAGGAGAGGSSAADEPPPPAAAAAAAAAAGAGASLRPTLGLPGLLGRLMSDSDDEGTMVSRQQQPQLGAGAAAGDSSGRGAAAVPAPIPDDLDAATQPLPSLDREQVYLNVEQWRQQQQQQQPQQQPQQQQEQQPLLPDGQAQAAVAPAQQAQAAAADYGALAEEPAPVVSKARRRRR